MSTLQDSTTVQYQVPRDVLVRILWRRMFFRPRRLVSLGLLILAGVLMRFGYPGHDLFIATLLIAVAATIPYKLHRALAKAVDENAQLTAPKTVEFNAARLIVTGPDWRSELPWTTFSGFSEDDSYFYLDISSNGFASIIPKSAFTTEQQQTFREDAKHCRDGRNPPTA